MGNEFAESLCNIPALFLKDRTVPLSNGPVFQIHRSKTHTVVYAGIGVRFLLKGVQWCEVKQIMQEKMRKIEQEARCRLQKGDTNVSPAPEKF